MHHSQTCVWNGHQNCLYYQLNSFTSRSVKTLVRVGGKGPLYVHKGKGVENSPTVRNKNMNMVSNIIIHSHHGLVSVGKWKLKQLCWHCLFCFFHDRLTHQIFCPAKNTTPYFSWFNCISLLSVTFHLYFTKCSFLTASLHLRWQL